MFAIIVGIVDFLLMSLFVAAFVVSLIVYCSRKEPLYLFLALLFCLFAFVEQIVYGGEIGSQLSILIHNLLSGVTVIKALLYIAISVVITLAVVAMLSKKLRVIHLLPSLFIAIWMLFFALSRNMTLFSGWLYILPFQLFMIGFSVYGLCEIRKMPAAENYRILKFVFTFTIILCVLIFVEDSLTIFSQEPSLSFNRQIKERNFSENVLFASYAITVTLCFSREIVRSMKFAKAKNMVEMATPIASDTLPSYEKKLAEISKELSLTAREAEVLPLLLENLRNQEIADRLYISMGTVKSHTHNIFQKLSVTDRNQLIAAFQRFTSGQ